MTTTEQPPSAELQAFRQLLEPPDQVWENDNPAGPDIETLAARKSTQLLAVPTRPSPQKRAPLPWED